MRRALWRQPHLARDAVPNTGHDRALLLRSNLIVISLICHQQLRAGEL
jgi:hypothetical protein